MANLSKRQRRLWDTYTLPGFRPQPTVRGVFGDPKARLIMLARRAKSGLRVLRAGSFGLVRPAYTAGSRSAVRRHAHLPGDRGPAGGVPQVWQGGGGAGRIFWGR